MSAFLLSAGVFLALPWLVVQLLPGIVDDYGVSVHHVEIRRPSLNALTIVQLEASIDSVHLKLHDARISYHASGLLAGKLEQLTVSQALISIEESATENAGESVEPEEQETMAAVPSPAAIFAAVPFSTVEIRQLTVKVPEVGFVGAGDVSYQDQQMRFAIYGVDPEPAQLLVARGRLNADGFISLDFAEFEPETRVFLAVESMLKDHELTVSAAMDLAGYPYQLVRSLLLMPAGDGVVRGEVQTVVPLPFSLEALAQLDIRGDVQIDWRSADDQLGLIGLEASGHYQSGDVQARFSGGAVQYDDESFSVQATLAPQTTLAWSGDTIRLGPGSSLRLAADGFEASGVSDMLTLQLATEPALTGGARLDLATEFGSLSGVLVLQAALQGSDEVTGAGTWRSAGQELPFKFQQFISTGAGELTSVAVLRISEPLAASLLDEWEEDYDLVAGELGYEFELQWDNELTGRLALVLNNVDASYRGDTVYGISGQPSLDIGSAGVSLAPFRVTAERVNPGVLLTDLEARIGFSEDLVSVEQAAFSLLGGRAQCSDFSYDLANSQAEFIIDLKAIDLSQLLALEGDDIQGEGSLNGHLPVQIKAGAPSISGGRLASLPPGGAIRLAPDFGALTGQPGLDFATKALTDYRYSSLTASVDYAEDGELKLGVSLEGRNPQVENGRPIHYNLNVSENVLVLLESLRAQRAVTEGIERKALKQK